jgi:lysophospholipase L1-like esterase
MWIDTLFERFGVWCVPEPARGERPSLRPSLEVLEDRTVPSATLRLGVIGDSASYSGTPAGAAGDREWTEVLQTLRPGRVQITNLANQNATSASMIADGQLSSMAALVAAHAVDDVVIVAGSNDVLTYLPTILAGNPAPFAHSVAANLATAIDAIADAGPVGEVVWNVPDLGITPAFRAGVTSDPALLHRVTVAAELANREIEAVAASRHVPVYNLFRAANDASGPEVIDGVRISQHLFAADGLHPSTAANGFVADQVLEALHEAYHVGRDLRLSDQEIFTLAGTPHNPGHTYFDERPYVIFDADGDGHGHDH